MTKPNTTKTFFALSIGGQYATREEATAVLNSLVEQGYALDSSDIEEYRDEQAISAAWDKHHAKH